MADGWTKLRELRDHLRESLFPDPPAVQRSLGRVEWVVLVASLLALAVVVQLARIGLNTSIDSLWAEDGSVFLQGAITHGLLASLIIPYAEYLVVVPRMIGDVASLAPLRDAAAAVSILSAAVIAVSGLVVWYATAGHIRSPYLRAGLAVLTVLAPAAGTESVDAAASVSWYMLFAAFWILLWRPATSWGAGLAALFLLATALSNPGVWFLLPLAALRAVSARDRRDLAIVGAYLIGSAIQVPVAVTHHEYPVEPLWTGDIITTFLQRVIAGVPLGLDLAGEAWIHLGWVLLIGLLLASVIGLARGARGAGRGALYVAALAIPIAIAMFLVSLYQRAVAPAMVWTGGAYNGTDGRYAIVPVLLLVSVALILADQPRARRWRRVPVAGAALLAVGLIAVATSFDQSFPVLRGTPGWKEALSATAVTCTTERKPLASIPISPPGWTVSLPCREVASSTASPPTANAP